MQLDVVTTTCASGLYAYLQQLIAAAKLVAWLTPVVLHTVK